MQLTKQERRALKARAIAVGLPEDASLEEVEAAEKAKGAITPKEEKKETVKSFENEEDTGKIFNLSTGTPSENKQAANKKVETNPVKAWGKPR